MVAIINFNNGPSFEVPVIKLNKRTCIVEVYDGDKIKHIKRKLKDVTIIGDNSASVASAATEELCGGK
jgi:hypothetical protein